MKPQLPRGPLDPLEPERAFRVFGSPGRAHSHGADGASLCRRVRSAARDRGWVVGGSRRHTRSTSPAYRHGSVAQHPRSCILNRALGCDLLSRWCAHTCRSMIRPPVHCERCGTTGTAINIPRQLGGGRWCRSCLHSYDRYRRDHANYLLRGIGIAALAIATIVALGSAVGLPSPRAGVVALGSVGALFAATIHNEVRHPGRLAQSPATRPAALANSERSRAGVVALGSAVGLPPPVLMVASLGALRGHHPQRGAQSRPLPARRAGADPGRLAQAPATRPAALAKYERT